MCITDAQVRVYVHVHTLPRFCWDWAPPVAGTLFWAALVANCFLEDLLAADLRAVCLVRDMYIRTAMQSPARINR